MYIVMVMVTVMVIVDSWYISINRNVHTYHDNYRPLTSACTPSASIGGTIEFDPSLHVFTTFSKYESGACPGKTFNLSRRL
jgi:hypothetical protein